MKNINIILLIIFTPFVLTACTSSSSTSSSLDIPEPTINSNLNINKVSKPATGISLSSIKLENLKLSKIPYGYAGYPGYQISGEVTNNSQIPFTGIEMTINAYDCPGSIINSDCSQIGEATGQELFVDGNADGFFPPNQTREGNILITGLEGMPPVRGNFLWSYSITGIWQELNKIPIIQ